MESLASEGQFSVYFHNGFWQPMDTLEIKLNWKNYGIMVTLLENMVMKNSFWNGRRVLITGHTGFKGSWLTLWLKNLGASICGYALKLEFKKSLLRSRCFERYRIKFCKYS